MAAAPSTSDTSTRKWLAVGIVGASIAVIGAISTVAIVLSNDRAGTSRLVFAAVLPLLGTWVGTVLAFYFARENLEAATETARVLSGIGTGTPVTRVMIPEAQFIVYDLGTADQL